MYLVLHIPVSHSAAVVGHTTNLFTWKLKDKFSQWITRYFEFFSTEALKGYPTLCYVRAPNAYQIFFRECWFEMLIRNGGLLFDVSLWVKSVKKIGEHTSLISLRSFLVQAVTKEGQT